MQEAPHLPTLRCALNFLTHESYPHRNNNMGERVEPGLRSGGVAVWPRPAPPPSRFRPLAHAFINHELPQPPHNSRLFVSHAGLASTISFVVTSHSILFFPISTLDSTISLGSQSSQRALSIESSHGRGHSVRQLDFKVSVCLV
ncbi:hypothetical protein PCANC_02986 [Puccinia coronata f. sp. avenae]|uniref:Uncharacterized protein n=1 Tax=Puccinia coronata f. sp. avenae TaxID=200324 RepID=A0A2N5W160_9BASI|nr:hypothetical protein PCANC_02986 [Puccinia coronata f. sp. avenae]